ncbi:CBO0543 family protein [Gracilibacillus sp. YIM 98692]|uniref:CBO0543 family protein n=1 Tax=Gracilibacillus sp. YIM 98692 TaxID=2663532 RepID=UPI0013D32BFB|nr:CBO0543 family protein [Gracilibacillus sp. YIM 98692]
MKPPKDYKEDLNSVIELMNNTQDLKLDIWREHVVFTGHWWIGVTLTIVPWLLWIFFRNKESSNRLLFVGFFLMIFSTFLDFIGTKSGLWFYYYDVIPFIPAFVPWDITLIPVSVMLLIEWKPQVNPFTKGLLFSGITAFAVEPLFVWIGLYQPVHWQHYYSFPIFFLLYLISHFLSKRKNFKQVSN